ncbi:MAG: divergent polysaccharide deacetylase family protein [Candidatus Omnitrophica bacterium]|nr:divergent polysaccharide deacetylase family protein [Candidatus Omnitrophota bacterium]
MNKINIRGLMIVIASVICAVFLFNAAKDLFHDRTLERILSAELAAGKVSNKDLVGKVKHAYLEKRYWVPDSFSFDDFEKRLGRSLDKAGFKLLPVSKTVKESAVKGRKEFREEASFPVAERSSSNPIFRLTLIRRVTPKPAPPKPKRPKLAIVLDDWGYNTKNLEALLQIDEPLTVSVLPDLPYSTLIAQKAKERGFEVILHMPMEPKAKMKLELMTLRTDMSENEIQAGLSKALLTVPGAAGVNNHEGSKATEDRRFMKIVFGELKKNNMFFLDSLVTNYSACEQTAKTAGVRFVKRSVFLDNESDPAYIKKQLESAMALALKNGSAVAIGHDRPNTIAVLKEAIPLIESKGIEMTYVSELAR